MQQTTLQDLKSHCIAAAFVADVPFFALADGTVHRWDGEPEALAVDSGLLSAIRTGDRTAILTGGEGGTVRRVERCGTPIDLASVPRKWITAVASGHAGAFAFGSGRTVWLHNGRGDARALQHASAVEDIAFAPDGSRIAVARYNGVTIHSLEDDGAPLELPWKAMNTRVTFSPDGRFLLAAMRESGLHGWRLEDAKHMRMLGYTSSVADWSWSAHGEWLATSGAAGAIVWPFEGDDGPMGKTPLELGVRETSFVTAVACHPARRMVAIGYDDGMIQTADINIDREVILRSAGGGEITSIAWDIAGTRIAFGSEHGECGVLEALT